MSEDPSPARVLRVALRPLQLGSGQVEPGIEGNSLWSGRLLVTPTRYYADAQIDDHRRLPRSKFPHLPPFHLSLLARTSVSQPLGTFGFGLWNDPFSLGLGQGGAGWRLPTTPQAVWFFYASAHADLALVPGLPGHGLKAAVLRSRRIPAPLLTPLAAAGIVASAFHPLRPFAFSQAARFFTAEEALLTTDPAEWHHYQIDWAPRGTDFRVDSRSVLSTQWAPVPPLGLILWMDNQYAVASPRRGFGFGVLRLESEQWLEIRDLEVGIGPPAASGVGAFEIVPAPGE
jgi:hypothetical protein